MISDVTGLSDSALDAAWAASSAAKDYNAASFYAAEIVARLTTVGSFVSGLLGIGADRFPRYQAASGFSQVDAARSSTTDATKQVVVTVADAAKAGAGAVADAAKTGLKAFGAGSTVVLIGAAVLLYIVHAKKK